MAFLKVFIYSLFLSFIVTEVYGQTCSITSSAPATGCVYCAPSSSVKIGSDGTLAQQIDIGLGATTGINMATGGSAGPVEIGVSSAAPTNSQTVRIGQYSGGNLVLGNFKPAGDTFIGAYHSNKIYLGRVDHGTTNQEITIGQRNAPPSPTPAPAQTIYIGRYSSSIQMGEFAAAVQIATAATAGSVTIGSPSNNPTQAINIGENSGGDLRIANQKPSGDTFIGAYHSNTIYLGRVGHSSTNQFVIIGQNNAPPSPTPAPQQTIFIGTYASAVNIATAGPTYVGATITIGGTYPTAAPSPTGSNRVAMRGLYHYFYWGKCTGTVGSVATMVCYQGSAGTDFRTNAAVGTGTSGYHTGTNFWYPPEPGHYFVTVTGLSAYSPGGAGKVFIVANLGGGDVEQARALSDAVTGTDQFSSITASAIITFNTVGANYYIFVQGEYLYGSNPTTLPYTTLTITRIA